MSIINLTQHSATTEQKELGVVELNANAKADVKALLTFAKVPSKHELGIRAKFITNLARSSGCTSALIGGAPYFMSALERELKDAGITPVYSFSVRKSEETTQPDGSVIKTNIFRHGGFVYA